MKFSLHHAAPHEYREGKDQDEGFKANMNISKRPAVLGDMEFARSVHHRAYRDVIERQYGPWDEEAQDKFFAVAWSAALHEIILCDSVRCGYTSIDNRAEEIEVRELVIDPQFQNEGIGTHIIKNVIADARARDVPVRLRTHLVNQAADLYRRLGFREYGRTDRHLLMEWICR